MKCPTIYVIMCYTTPVTWRFDESEADALAASLTVNTGSYHSAEPVPSESEEA